MELKNYVVLKMDGFKPQLWTREEYNDYIAACVKVGAGSAYKIISHFNGDEDLLTEQASLDGWVDEYLSDITVIMRKADKMFQTTGGGTRHYLRDVFLPLLQQDGFSIVKSASPPPTN